MKDKDYIKYLTIDESILRHPKLKGDYAMKMILGYIVYRLNLEKKQWTFSQSEIEHQLGMSQKMVNRRCKKLESLKILSFGDPIKCKTGEYIPMSVNLSNLHKYIGQVKVTYPKVKVTYPLSQGDLGSQVKVTCTNKDSCTKKDSTKKYSTNKDVPVPSAESVAERFLIEKKKIDLALSEGRLAPTTHKSILTSLYESYNMKNGARL